jgi:hypothetical protein
MRFELLSFVAASLCDLLDSVNVKAEFPVDTIVCHLNSLSFGRPPGVSRIAAGASGGSYQRPALDRQGCGTQLPNSM